MLGWNRVTAKFVAGVVLLGLFLNWFISNFLYDLLWDFLGRHGIRQADMIAVATVYFLPFVAAAGIVSAIYFALRREFTARRPEAGRLPIPDMKIATEREQHFRTVIADMAPSERIALRQLLVTDNAKSISDQDWQKFHREGLVDHRFSGPAGVKLDLRELAGRLSDELPVVKTPQDIELRQIIEEASEPPGLRQQFYIEIINTTSIVFEHCIVKVLHIEGVDDARLTNPLPIALRTRQLANRGPQGSFVLRPGEPKKLPLCQRGSRYKDGRTPVNICYEEAAPWVRELPDSEQYVIELGFYGSPVSNSVKLKIYVDSNNRLHVERANDVARQIP